MLLASDTRVAIRGSPAAHLLTPGGTDRFIDLLTNDKKDLQLKYYSVGFSEGSCIHIQRIIQNIFQRQS